MSIRRTRLSPEESRSAAIAAARRLLIADGPQAVTLKAVAAEVGRTHANLLHHFGSAAGLQGELAKAIADSVSSTIADAVEKARAGETDARDIINRTYDVFDREGAGALAAWMILTGNRDALDPILGSIRALVVVNGTAVPDAVANSSYVINASSFSESSDHLSVYLRGLAVNDEIYVSASATNARNQSIARLLQSYGRLNMGPAEATDLYTRQCSLDVTAKDLAVMGATLADGGGSVVPLIVLDWTRAIEERASSSFAGRIDERRRAGAAYNRWRGQPAAPHVFELLERCRADAGLSIAG